jgi:mannosyltransferase
MSDLSEVLVQIGSLIPRNIRFMVRRKLRCLIATRRRNKFAFLAVCLLVVGEVLWHIHSFQVPRPSRPLDAPFSVQCQEPITNGPRENAAFVMLARNKELEGALQAITSLERQFNRWFHYPIVFINDVPWERDFIDALSKAASGKVQFETIGNDTGMWGFPDWMDKDRARASMKLQEKNKVLYGGMESYHHMCRYNSG